jgi:large subunit ribosomal protein L19
VQDIIKSVEKEYLTDKEMAFNSGDTIAISFTIKEGNKTRTQTFQGTVIQIKGKGLGKTFTVRKSSGSNIYVERIFPFNSPLITNIKVIHKGRVRRAKLFYLRDRVGKATRIKEKK